MRPHFLARMPAIPFEVQKERGLQIHRDGEVEVGFGEIVDAARSGRRRHCSPEYRPAPDHARPRRPCRRRPSIARRRRRPRSRGHRPCGSPRRQPTPRSPSRGSSPPRQRPLRPAKRRWRGRCRANRLSTRATFPARCCHVRLQGRPRRPTMLGLFLPRRFSMARLGFGAFLAPHHPIGENPMLQFRRDIKFVEHLDELGYDEFWCGEHHSSGWEMIASPEMFLAAAGEHTKRIKLATGVISLPYHHPFNVAQRMVQLDDMTGGRAIFGSGPGALPSDAYTLRHRSDDPARPPGRGDRHHPPPVQGRAGHRQERMVQPAGRRPRSCCRCRRICRSPSPRRSALRA